MESTIEPPSTQSSMQPARPELPVPSRILIRSSNWLGDAVMTVPAVRAIKRSIAGVKVSVLTRSKLADFWKIVPEVDEVIEIAPRDTVFAVARKIRSGFDMAVLLPNSVRSAIEVFLARIPRRVGYRGKSRSWLLNEILPGKMKPGPPEHQYHNYLALAEFAGAKIDKAACNEETALGTNHPESKEQGKLKIGLCPGAEYGPAKRWLPERFAEVVNSVSKRRECEWLFFGTSRDQAVGGQIVEHIEGDVTNLIGKTTLAELITALSECRLLLTNDTGTMHLAAFLGVPTVSIFGSTEPTLTGPLGTGHRILRHHVECSPCFLRECPLDFRCMRGIETDEVVEAVLRMVEE